MPGSDRRTKTLSVRISQLEYEDLKTQFHDHGARNVSDLARLALQRLIAGSFATQGAFATKLLELDDRVHAIESKLSRL